ncbi:zinc finger CCCH-type antiviral protein 1-like [Micropterus salmoides]|uniref:zinc finger CCCH-type antiviral protein 1-like n=1 Tax=Micropterus salmoides TaxID=27706 RepID=UPI0018EACC31|nr:zinc finger CCCH-type antiviral protein 1-like [Micropterus salmoides]
MAAAHQPKEENSCENESEPSEKFVGEGQSDDEESEDGQSDDKESEDGQSDDEQADDGHSGVKVPRQGKEPCKYYNSGGCRDGGSCSYPHVCKYAVKGNCRYGSGCKLNHPRGGRASSGSSNRTSGHSTSSGPKLTDGRCYQWQLKGGKDWLDIDNDHIIEAQYSLPHTKSIKIYGTPYGAVSIDLNRMRVYGKSLSVRRLDDGKSVWMWYCSLRRKWIKYGGKDSKGNISPVKSSDIESKFQSNPTGSFTFNIGADTFEIRFKDMQQVCKQTMRKVTRRPVSRQKQAGGGASQAVQALHSLSLGTTPQWQFEGDGGTWHEFKHRMGTKTESSVTSDDIEKKYQQNHCDSIIFKVNGNSYKLDLGAMIQTNLKTNRKRKIRRVLV